MYENGEKYKYKGETRIRNKSTKYGMAFYQNMLRGNGSFVFGRPINE